MTAATRYFFNQRADTWDRRTGAEKIAVSERLIRGLRIRPGSRVLDVGCGTGVIIPWLLEAVGETGRVTALDIAEEMLSVARGKRDAPNVEYIHADIAHAPFLACSFDEVVCHNCFPHLAEKEKAVREMFRVLGPGGRVSICHNESRDEVNALHRAIGGIVGMDTLPGAEEMEGMFSRAGFKAVSIHEGRETYLLRARKPGAAPAAVDAGAWELN